MISSSFGGSYCLNHFGQRSYIVIILLVVGAMVWAFGDLSGTLNASPQQQAKARPYMLEGAPVTYRKWPQTFDYNEGRYQVELYYDTAKVSEDKARNVMFNALIMDVARTYDKKTKKYLRAYSKQEIDNEVSFLLQDPNASFRVVTGVK